MESLTGLPLIVSACGVLLVGIGVIVFHSLKSRQCIDWWAPPLFITYFAIVAIPGSLLQGINPDRLERIANSVNPSAPVDQVVLAVGVLATGSYLLSLLGTLSAIGHIIGTGIGRASVNRFPRVDSEAQCRYVFAAIALVAGFLYVLWVMAIGGLGAIWSNLDHRTAVSGGAHYLMKLFSWGLLFTVSTYGLLQWRYSGEKSTRLVLLISTLCAAVEASTGGRMGAVIVLIVFLLCMNYWKRSVNPFSGKVVILGGALAVFIVVWGGFRASDMTPIDIIHNPKPVIQTSISEVGRGLVKRVGNYDMEAAVVAGFWEPKDIWLGAGYSGLLTAAVPRGVYPEKPPVDDGVYVYTLVRRGEVEPGMSAAAYTDTAWPPGNWAGFMNWHIPGLLAFSYLSGVFARLFYSGFNSSGRHPFWLVMYAMTLVSVSFSVKGLVDLLMMVVAAVVFSVVGRTPNGILRAVRTTG